MSEEKVSGVRKVGQGLKDGTKSVFTGEPGSAFWLVEQFILWIRRTVESVNAYLSARRVSKNGNDEVNDE